LFNLHTQPQRGHFCSASCMAQRHRKPCIFNLLQQRRQPSGGHQQKHEPPLACEIPVFFPRPPALLYTRSLTLPAAARALARRCARATSAGSAVAASLESAWQYTCVKRHSEGLHMFHRRKEGG
jgi:hypothetical protein